MNERANRVAGAALQHGVLVTFIRHRLEAIGQRQPSFARPALHLGNRFVADAPRRHVYDAVQADGVRRILSEAQVGQDVLYFLALVEPGPTHQAVRDAATDECVFQRPGLSVDAIHDRHIAKPCTLRPQHPLDLAHDKLRLVGLVVSLVHDDG